MIRHLGLSGQGDVNHIFGLVVIQRCQDQGKKTGVACVRPRWGRVTRRRSAGRCIYTFWQNDVLLQTRCHPAALG